jgi:hypothetical protein
MTDAFRDAATVAYVVLSRIALNTCSSTALRRRPPPGNLSQGELDGLPCLRQQFVVDVNDGLVHHSHGRIG